MVFQRQMLDKLFVFWLQAIECLKGNVPADKHLDKTVEKIHLE
jgi:hypothetical protein